MEIIRALSRRKIILVTIAVIVVVIGVAAAIFFANSTKNDSPTKSKVEPGQTITAEQLEQQNAANNGTSSGSGNSNQSSGNAAQSTPTKDDFYNLIVQSNTITPDNQGHVSFGILKVVNPLAGWYVVTIKSGSLEPAKVIFRQTNDENNPLTIFAGPGTYFPPDTIVLPDAVRKATQ